MEMKMPSKKDQQEKPTLKIGDKEYDIENLTDESKALVAQIRFMENKLNNLNMETTVLRNSRQAALSKLTSILEQK
jgi:hypothetical protein